MIQCPKCGAYSPDGFIGCRECFHPFGSEVSVQATDIPVPKTGIVKNTPLDLLPYVIPEIASAPNVEEDPSSGALGSSAGPPPPIKPVGDSARYVRAARNLRISGWVLRIGIAVVIFSLTIWMIHSRLHLFSSIGPTSYNPNPDIQQVLDNMNALQGWVADLQIVSSDMSSDFCGNWEGRLTYAAPDRFAFSASSGKDFCGVIIVNGKGYQWNTFSSSWEWHGNAYDEEKALNPIWNDVYYDKLSATKEGTEEVNGVMCQVYSFDQEVKGEGLGIEFYETSRMDCKYSGKFYVDPDRGLLIALDVEMNSSAGTESSCYRYDFNNLGEKTVVNVPQQLKPKY